MTRRTLELRTTLIGRQGRISGPAAEITDRLDSLFTRLQQWIDVYIPLGYEDESGFHFGPEPTSQSAWQNN